MSVSSVRPPPSSFPSINTQKVTKGIVLHRTHGSSFRPAQFNPCMGQPTRFAPFPDSAGACVPTLYAATSREAAAFESIFHDIEPTAVFKTVRLDVIESRSVSRIAPKRDLLLAGLFALGVGHKPRRSHRDAEIDLPSDCSLGSSDSQRQSGR